MPDGLLLMSRSRPALLAGHSCAQHQKEISRDLKSNFFLWSTVDSEDNFVLHRAIFQGLLPRDSEQGLPNQLSGLQTDAET